MNDLDRENSCRYAKYLESLGAEEFDELCRADARLCLLLALLILTICMVGFVCFDNALLFVAGLFDLFCIPFIALEARGGKP